MKPDLEFVGKNVKEAVEKASDELKIPRGKIKYDVISNGSSGIFGLVGVKKAKIRVSLPGSECTTAKTLKTGTDGKERYREESVKSLVDEAFNGTGYTRESDGPKAPESASKPDDSSKPDNTDIDLSSEQIQTGIDALQKIIDLITTDARVSVEKEQNRVVFNVIGGNPGVLIGKRGQNLEAIQYLIDKMVNKQSEKRIRLQVDVEGYLKTRRENLTRLAEKLAEKTKKTGRPSTIGQISAQDRRTVHLTLKSDKEVRTQSIGDGYYRKLVIFPRKSNYKRKRYHDKVSANR
ncbi:MAG: RNA-binding cell elongation regulator Jag/EloR [Desulfobacterales bacterium]